MKHIKQYENKKTYNIGDIVAYRLRVQVKKQLLGITFTDWEYVKAVGQIIEKEKNTLYHVKDLLTNDTILLTTKAIAGLASKQTIEEVRLDVDINKYNL